MDDALTVFAPGWPGVPARWTSSAKTGLGTAVSRNSRFRLYVLLAPHLGNRGAGNTAWVGEYHGMPMLLAERENYALASSTRRLARSVGFVGFSDGWQQLQADKRLNQNYTRAVNGNVALTGEIDLRSSDGTFVIARDDECVCRRRSRDDVLLASRGSMGGGRFRHLCGVSETTCGVLAPGRNDET